MSKFIWSNTNTVDYLLDLEPDELRNVLADFGYDMEMLEETPDEELENIVYDDVDIFDNLDIEDWEQSIAPELSKQTKYGLIFQIDNNGGELGSLDDVFEVNYDAHLSLMADDNDDVYMLETARSYPTGRTVEWYTYPKNEGEFAVRCLEDLIQEKLELYGTEGEYTEEDAIEDTVSDLIDNPWYVIDQYCDYSKVPEVCERFKAPALISNKEESLEEEFMIEAKSKNPELLKMELEDIKSRLDSVREMTFVEFCDTFPEFTKSVISTFCKEMIDNFDIINEDPELAEFTWEDFDDRDWKTFINGAEKLADKRSIQWDKIYKNYYNELD